MNPSRLQTTAISPDQLDPQSVAYLRQIEASGGVGQPGIFLWQTGQWFAGPRGGWALLLCLGLALLGGLAVLCWKAAPQATGARWLPGVQAALAGLGALCLLVGLMRFLRPQPPWLPKSFLYADANYLWEVTPGTIAATPLWDLQYVDGRHHFSNGAYASSTLDLTLPDGQRRWTLHNQASAEHLVGFLQCLLLFRHSADEQVRAWAAMSPGRLGAAAGAFVASGGNFDAANLPATADPPEPHAVAPDPAAPKYGWRGACLCLLGAAGLGMAAVFAFPLLNGYLQDEYLFARIPAQDNGRLDELQRYLAVFPDGRHAALVREMLDDRSFAKAQRDATQQDSPSALRAYLANRSNQRHRPAAQQLIVAHYDRAIADIKKRVKGWETSDRKLFIDPELFAGVLALLEALKRVDYPVVTVGFKATLEREPVTAEQKLREQLSYQFYLTKEPELKAIADRSPSRSAILGAGQVFDKEQTARREAVILERLRAAIKQGIPADILTLEPAVPGEQPVMEVAYQVRADGDLGTYRGMNKQLVGLLRWYALRWTITIRPPKTEKSFVYTLQSKPGANLTYDSEPSDPDWAIAAVLLYSGFHDMSARLIRNFGLDPGPAPNAFNFAAVARNAPEQPQFPVNPFPPNPFGPPKLPRR